MTIARREEESPLHHKLNNSNDMNIRITVDNSARPNIEVVNCYKFKYITDNRAIEFKIEDDNSLSCNVIATETYQQAIHWVFYTTNAAPKNIIINDEIKRFIIFHDDEVYRVIDKNNKLKLI